MDTSGAKIVAALLLALACVGSAEQASPSVDEFARAQVLNAALLASSSATRTLEQWCGTHHLAAEPRVTARRVNGGSKPLTPDQRRRLDVGDREPVRYRRVELTCGSRVLSIADNWYVPSRLTPEMNQLLETTDTPFGKTVAPLQPTRETFAVKLFWTDTAQPVPAVLFEHRAVLYTTGHRPFSEVDEMYQRALVAE